MLETNAAAHKKQQKSLSPDQKGQIKSINAAAHKRKYQLLSPEKKQDSWKTGLNNVMNI